MEIMSLRVHDARYALVLDIEVRVAGAGRDHDYVRQFSHECGRRQLELGPQPVERTLVQEERRGVGGVERIDLGIGRPVRGDRLRFPLHGEQGLLLRAEVLERLEVLLQLLPLATAAGEGLQHRPGVVFGEVQQVTALEERGAARG